MIALALTKRQAEVAGCVAAGMGNARIAAELNITRGTVKEYLNRIFRRLKVHNRTALAVYWINEGPTSAPVEGE